jgi:hypothetical protein
VSYLNWPVFGGVRDVPDFEHGLAGFQLQRSLLRVIWNADVDVFGEPDWPVAEVRKPEYEPPWPASPRSGASLRLAIDHG